MRVDVIHLSTLGPENQRKRVAPCVRPITCPLLFAFGAIRSINNRIILGDQLDRDNLQNDEVAPIDIRGSCIWREAGFG